MGDLRDRVRALGLNTRFLIGAVAGAVARHWLLAIGSLIAAFALWFAVEDVENPRVAATVPVENHDAVPVEVVNVPAGLIVGDVGAVRVVVEAREADVDELRAGDFSATVDASAMRTNGVRTLPVTVATARGDVRVLRAVPGVIEVSAVAAVSRELPVTVVATGELPSGFRQGLPEVDPPFVTATGRAELVESVNEVQATVSISGLRTAQTFNVELAARTSDGSRVTVTLSQNRARVTVPVEEALLTRRIAVLGGVRGSPAPGYAVTGVAIAPSPIEVTGPREIVEAMGPFTVDDIDVSGAIAEVVARREIALPDEVSAEVSAVFATASIEPQRGWRTLRLSPVFTDVPEGLAVADGVYAVELRVTGDEPLLAGLTHEDVTATVSFAEAEAGIAIYEAEVAAPEGVLLVVVRPLSVELVELASLEEDEEGADGAEEGDGAEDAASTEGAGEAEGTEQ